MSNQEQPAVKPIARVPKATMFASGRTPLTPGTLIEHYKVGKVIGMGSFSLVYRGYDNKRSRSIVIKEYFPKHFSKRAEDGLGIVPFEGTKLITFNEGFRQFFTEALALHKINHPNVLKTQNIFRANNTAYMISNKETGRDLKWFISTTNKPFSKNLIYKIFMPILSSLNLLHQTGCLHLDIKPANILLRANSEPLLLDFGAVQDMTSEKRINKNMQTLTHGFAPPEQYDRKSNLGPWTDIYAVAATLYHAITNELPVKSRKAKEQSQLDVDKYSEEFPQAMLKAINQALVLDYPLRFQTIDAFTEQLLSGSKWQTLQDYELQVMGYDRFGDHDTTPPLRDTAA